MQVLLDPSNIESAVQLVTKVDGHKVSLQVIMHRVKKRPKVNFLLSIFRLVRRCTIYSITVISEQAVKKQSKITVKAVMKSSRSPPNSA